VRFTEIILSLVIEAQRSVDIDAKCGSRIVQNLLPTTGHAT
jgi:hypothetical protein